MNFKIFARKFGGQFAPELGGQFNRYMHKAHKNNKIGKIFKQIP